MAPGRAKAFAAALLLALGLGAMLPGRGAAQGAPLQVTFLNVGQGDAVVVRSPEGRTAMIDAGPGSPLRFLQQMSVDSLDLLVATHPHADHIGGMEDVLTARPVRFYMDNGRPHPTATYERLMATLERLESVTYLQATPRTITLGSVTIEVLPIPTGELDQNDTSVGLVVRYGDFTALLTGDSERYELDAWASRDLVPGATLLKAPHHGSVNGFTRPFLRAARPEIVVVSVGADNRYGHPRPEAMTAFDAFARHVLRTDRDGHVTVLGFTDGSYEIVTGGEDLAEGGIAAPSPEGTPPPLSENAPSGLSVSVVANAPGDDHEHLNGEYATVYNSSSANVAIGGWRLCDLRSRCFRFPPGSRILAGGQVRVYTGYGASDGFAFFMNNDRAVWNNDGDEATLYDERGTLVVRFVY
jgi:competence protein ComEC